ncbi:hypothetical protein TH53_25640 [Pedobacter lusitanus]|uniref:Uncharacterized protein n=1 Tax=Pedobacter lusitanus TaxID=1503925 RepID=A0A0D0EYW7_9SPHI|nr:hypothetical protein [Pedobacter lusitanus]KIO74578.1 hypothetical protein TH53_25640 [Pedobacter lusitanus]
MEGLDIIYRNRLTNKEVGRTALPGKDVTRYTDAKNQAELIANNFDQPQVSAATNTSGTATAPQAAQRVDYQDMSQPTTSLAVANNVATGFAYEYVGAKVLSGVSSLFTASETGRVFWSGGEVAKTAAADFAKANGMKTLEMTTTGRAMNSISPYLPRSATNPVWNSLSRSFANGASGEAHFFTIPAGPRSGSIWLNVEKPILEQNAVKIISH